MGNAEVVETPRFKSERRGFGIFHSHNPPSRTMVLGSTLPLTEMSTRNISLEVKAAGV